MALSVYNIESRPVIFISRPADMTTFKITIHEGRNRQVRRMLERIGHPVNSLKRISFGSLELGDLKPGKWRHVKPEEIARLTEER